MIDIDPSEFQVERLVLLGVQPERARTMSDREAWLELQRLTDQAKGVSRMDSELLQCASCLGDGSIIIDRRGREPFETACIVCGGAGRVVVPNHARPYRTDGDRLRRQREESGLSVQEAASRHGVTSGTWLRMEQGILRALSFSPLLAEK